MTISRSQMERQLRMGGGIMNIENRQKYVFGGITKSIKKAVKGATNAAKKVVKSPLGKAAILGAIGFGIPGMGASGGLGGGLFGRASIGGAAPGIFGFSGIGNALGGGVSKGLLGKIGLSGSAGKAALGIGAVSTLAGILASDAEMTEEEAEELKQDPAALRNYLRLYYSNLNPNASKEEVDSFVRTNMYADGGRVNYQQGSQPAPAPAQPTQPGSLQGATSLYGDVVEYLKRQGRQSDQPRMISPDEISGPMPATPYPFSGAGSFLGGGAINTPTPPTGGNNVGITNLPRNKEKEQRMLGLTTPAPTTPAPIVKKQPIIDFSPYLSMENINVKIDPLGRKTINATDSKKLSEGITAISQLLQKKYTDDMYGKNRGKKRDEAFASYFGEYDPDSIYWAQYGRGKNARVQSDEDFGTYIDPQTREITKFNQGGRVEYAMGSPEQNAMQAAGIMDLPLNQNKAGVTELDLRKSGGFIPPVGVKEKADDIPAMLSNNEFVFTADAVRGMGNGNVNKGAQRMYDMMKKLEKGGRV